MQLFDSGPCWFLRTHLTFDSRVMMTTGQLCGSCKGGINTRGKVFPLILWCWTRLEHPSIFRTNRHVRSVCVVRKNFKNPSTRESFHKVFLRYLWANFPKRTPYLPSARDNQLDRVPPGAFSVRRSLDGPLGCLWPAWGVIKVQAKFICSGEKTEWAEKKLLV